MKASAARPAPVAPVGSRALGPSAADQFVGAGKLSNSFKRFIACMALMEL